MNRRSRRRPAAPLVLVLAAAAALSAPHCNAQQLLPDIVPWVREDARYLINWDISSGELRMETMFANIGDGLLQIRTDAAGTGGPSTPVTQRIFSGVDNGPFYTDYAVNSAVNFHQAHGHIHFEDFSEFQLLEAVYSPSGIVTVGGLVTNTEKTSFRIRDTERVPDIQFAGAISYPSSNTGLYQNVSVGFGDVYSHGTEGQSISLSGVPFGPKYWLRQIADPTNVLREKDETNNSFEILIDLNRPGEALRHLNGRFVRPGDVAPPLPGDLTGDRMIDIHDWIAFRLAANSDLSGLNDEEAFLLGDLNLDRKHTIRDVLLFRRYFDEAHGAGAFAAIEHVPEPCGLVLGGGALVWLLMRRRGTRRGLRRRWLHLALVAAAVVGGTVGREAAAKITLFYEDFETVALGPSVHETPANPQAWTDTPPAGWVVDDSGVPFVADASRGVAEWEGWSFADKDWWVTVAGDQQRSQFTRGQGTVAVADPDEWDDRGNPINGSPFAGYYNALVKTPPISLASAPPGTARLSFASSWRDECCDDGPTRTNNQTARVRVSYNDGASYSELLRWESAPASPSFKNDAINEAVVVALNNPAGASEVIIEFGLLNAGNDWWWAIDNIEVFTPTVLEVNTTTGELTIVGAFGMTGYEITSVGGALNAAGWEAGNLDAQNFGPSRPLTADFNKDHLVDAADYVVWRRAFATSSAGDATGDGDTDELDYVAWRQQFGEWLAAGASWETLIATNNHLLEFFLSGSSTFPSRSIGLGYDPAVGARDLAFTYTTADDQELTGIVRYLGDTGAASAAVPEPHAATLLMAGISAVFLALGGHTRREGWSRFR